jgi:hypothetical protein
MKRRDILNLGLSLGLVPRAMAANTIVMDDATYNRLITRRYAPEFYTPGNNDRDKTSGIHQIKIDNRTLEIILSVKPTPDDFFMPESLRTTGDAESIIRYLLNRMRQSEYNFGCFEASWEYGLMRGAFAGPAVGSIGAALNFHSYPIGFIKGKNPFASEFTSEALKVSKAPIEVDYFKLEDFLIAVRSWPPQPFSLVTINGRRWVRIVSWTRTAGGMLAGIPPKYIEKYYTPLDRHRILTLNASLHYQTDYKIPDEMPGWMRELCGNITSILRSIKLSPPDDGSEDPFLLDPKQKAEQPPIEFPAQPGRLG